MRITEIKISNASSDLNNTIFVRSSVSLRSLIAVFNLNAARINRLWIFSLVPTFSTIDRMELSNVFDLGVVLIKFPSRDGWVVNNLNRSPFALILNLRNTNSLNNIAFRLKKLKCLIKLSLSNTKFSLDSGSYIKATLFLKLFFKPFCCLFCTTLVHFSVLVEPRTNGGLINTKLSSDLRISEAIILQ